MTFIVLAFLLLLSSDPKYSESIVVSGIRADEATPVTKTDIPRKQIQERYQGQDVPLLLRDAPSVHAWAESGVGGSGYSYITLRGVSPTRINFTLDGVPLADSEDMGTYFADFPDLARSLQSIQIQRGVGTSTFGSASFGGSVNMESLDVASEQHVDATFGGGSYGNRQATIGVQSGALPGGLAFYTRVSSLESRGFRENAGTRQRNVFFSGTKLLGDAQLKLTGFSGHEAQQLHYYAADAETLQHDPRNNPMRPEEKDSFGYDLAQLQYIKPLGPASDMTASVYYQRGYGTYRLFDSGTDNLREYGLDGLLLGSILTYSHRAGAFTWNTGLHVNRFQRDHTRDDLGLTTGPAGTPSRDYANYGVKDEANAFAKVTWASGALLLYGDAQVRRASFDYHGDVGIPSIRWTFFNPKVGARYGLSSSSSVYASAGVTTREPARSDLFLGEDNPTTPFDLHAVRPERLLDLEAGWNGRVGGLDLAANVYAMEFHNEIASTGEINELGLLLRRNVDRSSRRGIELDATWQAMKTVRLNTSASFSRNRIHHWTQFFDVYDDAGNYAGSRPVSYRDVEPLLTPKVIVNQSLDYTPNPRFSTGAVARWVGRSYLDNTNDSAFTTPSFVTIDAKASYGVTPSVRVSLQVNNLTNENRVYASGYSYRYLSAGVPTGTSYFFPQATRNVVVLMDVTR
jgi:iron complex outermembrane receptor protein